jgi:hypothetical protein
MDRIESNQIEMLYYYIYFIFINNNVFILSLL